jgi:hypothetical protein
MSMINSADHSHLPYIVECMEGECTSARPYSFYISFFGQDESNSKSTVLGAQDCRLMSSWMILRLYCNMSRLILSRHGSRIAWVSSLDVGVEIDANA